MEPSSRDSALEGADGLDSSAVDGPFHWQYWERRRLACSDAQRRYPSLWGES